jgi:two-component system, cell cycle sensor histidine kinase and response regulator CckA
MALRRPRGWAHTSAGATTTCEMAGLRRTVLLVDDNDIVRELTKAMLERHGFAVLDASTPRTALALASSLGSPIDLLVTDVYMPGMNGLELADRIIDLHPRVSVLYTSGHTDERILAPGTVPAGAAFLPKPFSMAELVRTTEDVFAATELLLAPSPAAA